MKPGRILWSFSGANKVADYVTGPNGRVGANWSLDDWGQTGKVERTRRSTEAATEVESYNGTISRAIQNLQRDFIKAIIGFDLNFYVHSFIWDGMG